MWQKVANYEQLELSLFREEEGTKDEGELGES